MSNFYIEAFQNPDRPQVLTELPVGILTEPEITELKRRLQTRATNGPGSVAAARFVEELSVKYPDIPYLLIRLGDVQMTLANHIVAIQNYRKVQIQLRDHDFGVWLDRAEQKTVQEYSLQARSYISNPTFSSSQRWKDSTVDDPFPYCRATPLDLDQLRAAWDNLSPPDTLLAQYLNLLCIDSNAIEGTVAFTESASTRLIQIGFFQQVIPITPEEITGGQVLDHTDAINLLKDTRKAADFIFEFLKRPILNLSVGDIKKIHETLMWSSHLLYTRKPPYYYSYCNAGKTRTQSRINVTINQGPVKIQFCPSDDVDRMLEAFCVRFNELIQKPEHETDPFASAAWISHVFVTIHPFEDGNGRLSRILSSIPLVRSHLPPLSIPPWRKAGYIMKLNQVRAFRDGDYSELTHELVRCTKLSVEYLNDIRNLASGQMG